uniref:Uncharacterized protein n=1 Tax=Meloidogyne enterolobii TaxID=390850 RepID=A0A6V7VI78_MELEN|nr:unnamed protein product [Meloidogyne enterolobii]
MLLRILILIFGFHLASCGHGSHGNSNQGKFWNPRGVASGQSYAGNEYGNQVVDALNDGTQRSNAGHHFPSQAYDSTNAQGNKAWDNVGNSAHYDPNQITQLHDNLTLHTGYISKNDPSKVYRAGHNIPIQTYGHTKTGGRDQKHSGDASSSRSRGKRIKQDNSPQEGLGHEEGQEGENVQEEGHMLLSIDPNEAKSYRVEIYLKRFDGGTVLLLEPWKEVLKHRNEVIEEVLHDKYSTINVEKVVKALGIADVKYHPVEDIENHKKDPELYGDVSFIEGSGKLRAAEGETISTKVLADRIADWSNRGGNISKWMVRGKNYQNEIFEPLFDGHMMVVLHDLEDGVERFRIHFTMDRLNLFDSVNKKNYFVIPHEGELVIMPEENVWVKGDPVRGTRWREDKFCPQKRRKMEVKDHLDNSLDKFDSIILVYQTLISHYIDLSHPYLSHPYIHSNENRNMASAEYWSARMRLTEKDND